MDFPPYIGLLSNWGALLWMATATICLFSALVIKQQRAGTPTIRFIGASGVLSLILAIDDLFLLHDRLLPELLHTPEITFYILYLIGILGYLLYFMPQILKHEYLLLGVAVLCFGLSRRYFVTLPFFDQFLTTGDMLKYFGIVFWLAFFSRTAFQEVGNALKASQP